MIYNSVRRRSFVFVEHYAAAVDLYFIRYTNTIDINIIILILIVANTYLDNIQGDKILDMI